MSKPEDTDVKFVLVTQSIEATQKRISHLSYYLTCLSTMLKIVHAIVVEFVKVTVKYRGLIYVC